MSRVTKYLACLMIVALPLVALTPGISQAKSSQESKKEDAVYITQNGKKYHKEGCRFIKNRETISISEQEAVSKGLVPCGSCFKENAEAKK